MKKITKKEYFVIVGLMELARRAYNQIRECEKAYGEVVGMKEDCGSFGHFSDEIFGDGNVDKALENEEIEVNKK